MAKSAETTADPSGEAGAALRERILAAAFHVLMERGYAGASTLEIARRARVSKRELYALFANKAGILTTLVDSRTARMRAPLELPPAHDLETLTTILQSFGAAVLRELCQPVVLALFRLAIAQAEESRDVALQLDASGRAANRAALAKLLAAAVASSLLRRGDSAVMASQFFGLLLGDLPISLLLRVTTTPTATEIRSRARQATAALLSLYATR